MLKVAPSVEKEVIIREPTNASVKKKSTPPPSLKPKKTRVPLPSLPLTMEKRVSRIEMVNLEALSYSMFFLWGLGRKWL